MELEVLVTVFQLRSCTLQGLTSLLVLSVRQAIGRLCCSLSDSKSCFVSVSALSAQQRFGAQGLCQAAQIDREFFNLALNKLRNSFQTHNNFASVSGICTRTRFSDLLSVL